MNYNDAIEKIKESEEFKNSKLSDLNKIYEADIEDELAHKIENQLSDLRKEISEALRSNRICFLTGNGSSIYAGTNDTQKFEVQNYFDNKIPEENDLLKLVGEESVEKVLNNLITVKNYNDLELKNNALVDEKLKRIEDDFLKNNVEGLDYSKLVYHLMLIRKLKNLNHLNKCRFYTLNYDLAFEYSLDKLGISYKNGFNGFINRIFGSKFLDSVDMPSIIKLHGSLTWYRNDDEFDIKERQPKFENNKIICDTDVPYLIYPTANKFMDSQNYPFSELMRNFLNDISNNKTVLFVMGYKFEDTHVNNIIMKALMNPNLIIFVFNYSAKNVFTEKIELLSKNDDRIKYFKGEFISDFRTFCRFLLPSKDVKDDYELIKELILGGSKDEK